VRARAVLGALVFAGCSATQATTTPAAATSVTGSATPATAAVTLSVLPNPVVTTTSRGPAGSRQLAWQTVLTDSSGVGATVNFLDVTLRNAATGELAEPQGVVSLSPTDVVAAAGSNHVPASGSLVVGQTLAFSNDVDGGRLEIVAQLVDDNGHVFGVSAIAIVD
jgi:hypothetical protein